MEQINGYYRKIYQMFSNKRNKVQNSNDNASKVKSTDELTTDLPKIQTIAVQNSSKSIKQKRNQKLIRKDQVESIKSFLSTLPDISISTKIQYTQIIYEFLSFSPECDIDDYENFLKFKSGTKNDDLNQEFIIEGTLIKYSHILKRYLFFVHNKDAKEIKISYYKKPKNKFCNPYPSFSYKDILQFSATLFIANKHEDAILICTMYELGLTPYYLSLLKFESLSESKTIKYYDHKSRSVKEVKLSESLYRNLCLLNKMKTMNNKFDLNEERLSLDGTIIKGKFIFSSKATGIFNRFKRMFGGTLKGINITPKDILVLSRFDKKNGINNIIL